MKILILGSKGMLGQMANAYFSGRYETFVLDKKYNINNREEFIKEIRSFAGCTIINCIGRIKQKSTETMELYQTNAILPFDLANNLGKDQILIQPSTDCVFSGSALSPYPGNHKPDAVDDYGWSKALGEIPLLERNNCYIIRVSIIGPDNSQTPKGLLGWFLANRDEPELNGFDNHYWNGITTLEWCKKIELLVLRDENRNNAGKILHLGTEESYSKYDLLRHFKEIFGTPELKIKHTSFGSNTNRCLLPDFISEDIVTQLIELKQNPYVPIT